MKGLKSKTNIYKVVFIGAVFLFIATLSFQVYISNSTALKGKDFRELYDKKEALNKEIAYLEYEDSQLSSLSYIEQKAGELGFQEMTEPLLPIKPPALAALNVQ